jgi:hypothetical protein
MPLQARRLSRRVSCDANRGGYLASRSTYGSGDRKYFWVRLWKRKSRGNGYLLGIRHASRVRSEKALPFDKLKQRHASDGLRRQGIHHVVTPQSRGVVYTGYSAGSRRYSFRTWIAPFASFMPSVQSFPRGVEGGAFLDESPPIPGSNTGRSAPSANSRSWSSTHEESATSIGIV